MLKLQNCIYAPNIHKYILLCKYGTCVMLQLLNTATGKNREAKEIKETESGCLFMP